MNNNTKKVKCIVFVTAIIVLLSVSIALFFTYFPRVYLSSVFPKEEYTECYDGKYGYLQLSSPKKLSCTLNVYDLSDPMHTAVRKQTLSRFFRDREMNEISWGICSYDLFFDTPEAGPYIYKFDAEHELWIGPLYLAKEETAEKHAQGDEASYCFEASYDTNLAEFPEFDIYDIFVLPKDTIPKSFLKEFGRSMAK